jgi:hypothetical protein
MRAGLREELRGSSWKHGLLYGQSHGLCCQDFANNSMGQDQTVAPGPPLLSAGRTTGQNQILFSRVIM